MEDIQTKAGAVLLLGLLASAFGAGCAEEARQDDLVDIDETSEALAGFALAERGEPGVVAIVLEDAKGQQSLCTGELVAPRVVLTAGHCTQAAKAATVLVGPTLDEIRESADVERILTHPDYGPKADLATGWSDIGALVLKTPLRAPPIKIRRARVDESLEGHAIKLVGFGTTVRTDPATAGIKRSGYALVSRVFQREIYVKGGPGFATGCGGDSGGPALILTTTGWELLALESRGDEACEVGTFKTRVDAHLPFVDQALALGR